MIPNYKDIVDLLKKGATVEAQEKIMELREGVLELQEENAFLKSQISELREQIKIKSHLDFADGVYWLWEEDEAGDPLIKIGPFCQRCYDDENKLVRLQSKTIPHVDVYGDTRSPDVKYHTCLKCRSNYD
ncbi:hypothetical protein OYT1_ch2560 [Ferriphaselus amnicola]|uniref:Uncharacterized protein n=1 Tax=Ferriphaselus amnicola TaxID=1188319 RepID=A0A2Z6GFB3_9PROT|nr:hypothetical protein [Ferriphaselus amnicola]BBE52072.1 hypothetical protein OYT1_ch2560 [Ferriphaselus amnicola]